MLYIEHMLRRYNLLGREGPILRDMQKHLPSDLSSLYDLILKECQESRTEEQYKALKTLFTWLAFSKRPLTLDEANALMGFTRLPASFIDEEIGGKSARILALTRLGEKDDAVSDQTSTDGLELESEELPEPSADDGSFPLRFQERSLREYFRAPHEHEDGLRTTPKAAHMELFFMTISILCGEPIWGIHDEKALTVLTDYAAKFWSLHFRDLDVEAASESEVRQVVSYLHKIMTHREKFAKTIELYGERNADLPSDYSAEFVILINKWALRAASLPDNGIPDPTSVWAHEDPQSFMMELARGHVYNWFKGNTTGQDNEGQGSFIYACFASRSVNVLSAAGDDLGDFEVTPELIFRTANTFPEIPKDAKAHQCIGYVLEYYHFYEETLKQHQRALDLSKTELHRFNLLYDTADVYCKLAGKEKPEGSESDANACYQKAYESILAALNIRPHAAEGEELSEDVEVTLQECFIVKAKCEKALGNPDDAIKSYEVARTEYKWLIPGDTLSQIPLLFEEGHRYTELMGLLEGWTFWDRLSWLAYMTDLEKQEEANELFIHASKETGKEDFMVACYEKIISYTDESKAGALPRYYLAHAFRRVIGDLPKAKATLFEILDGEKCITPATEEENIEILLKTRFDLSDIIYEQFRSSSDRKEKVALLEEFKGIPERRLARESAVFSMFDSVTAVIMARMARKVGLALEFQDVLEQTFKSCVDALSDTEGWNDGSSLQLLAKVLVSIEGLTRDAQIALSAQFSIIDPEVSHGDDEDKNNTTESAEETTEDLAPDFMLFCDGQCGGTLFSSYANGPVYSCLVCAACDFCEPCYLKRKAYNRGEPSTYWKTYCGTNHQYIRAPIDGWKGIKGGVVSIGDEKFEFADWLKGLKEDRWGKAWETFWKNEELGPDII